jgi:hypothetical protein
MEPILQAYFGTYRPKYKLTYLVISYFLLPGPFTAIRTFKQAVGAYQILKNGNREYISAVFTYI